MDYGTAEKPDIREVFTSMSIPYSQRAEELAKREAYNGEYTIEEVPDEPREPTEVEQLRADVDELTLALADILGGGMV